MTHRSVLEILTLTTVLSCRSEDCDRPSASEPQLPPLAAPSPVTTLSVKGSGNPVVALPIGATRPMPVLVAVLGVGDTPEEQCATWRDIVGPRAFVVCPRGAPNMVAVDAGEPAPKSADGDPGEERAAAPAPRPEPARLRQVGFYPVDVPTLDREITSALDALEARWGAHVARRDVVYAGFSRGAFLGASLAAKHPDRFPRLVLIEGGHDPWQAHAVASFAKGGGKRVLFACGQPSCVDDAEPVAATLRAQQVETRVVHGVGEGHGYRKQVKEELRRAFDWVVEGDPRWRAR